MGPRPSALVLPLIPLVSLASPLWASSSGIRAGVPWVYEPSVAGDLLGYAVSTAGDVNGGAGRQALRRDRA